MTRRDGLLHRRFAWAPLVLALLIQAFAPDWATVVMRATADPAVAAADLCLAPGHADDRSGTDTLPHRRDEGLCPICQAFGAVQVAVGCVPQPDVAPRQSGRRLRRRPPRPPVLRPREWRPKARDPPVFLRS